MKKIFCSAMILIAGYTLRAQPTNADSQSASQSVTLNLQNTVSIIIGFGFENDTGIAPWLQRVFRNTNDSSIVVKSNRRWAVTVISAPANAPNPDVADMPEREPEPGNYQMAMVYTATQL